MKNISLLIYLSYFLDKEYIILIYINNLVKDRPILLRLKGLVD